MIHRIVRYTGPSVDRRRSTKGVPGFEWVEIREYVERYKKVCAPKDYHSAHDKRHAGEYLLFAIPIILVLPLPVITVVVPVELIIRWNHLEGLKGVSTIGQLIPFLVGCFSILRAIGLAYFSSKEGEQAQLNRNWRARCNLQRTSGVK